MLKYLIPIIITVVFLGLLYGSLFAVQKKKPPKKQKKIIYVIHPGYVKSKNDGETHYVTYASLLSLYGLSPINCTLPDHNNKAPSVYHGYKCMHLYPQADGDYNLNKEISNG